MDKCQKPLCRLGFWRFFIGDKQGKPGDKWEIALFSLAILIIPLAHLIIFSYFSGNCKHICSDFLMGGAKKTVIHIIHNWLIHSLWITESRRILDFMRVLKKLYQRYPQFYARLSTKKKGGKNAKDRGNEQICAKRFCGMQTGLKAFRAYFNRKMNFVTIPESDIKYSGRNKLSLLICIPTNICVFHLIRSVGLDKVEKKRYGILSI